MSESTENPWTFIHFGDYPKLGINPKSPPNEYTPIGIYGWPERSNIDIPARSVWEQTSKFKIIFEAKLESRPNIWTIGDGPSEFEDGLGQLVEKLSDSAHRVSSDIGNYFDKMTHNGNLRTSRDAYIFLKDASTKMSIDTRSIAMTKIIRGAGIEGVVDWGTGAIYGSEKEQGVFFSPRSLSLIEIEDRSIRRFNYLNRVENSIKKTLSNLGLSKISSKRKSVESREDIFIYAHGGGFEIEIEITPSSDLVSEKTKWWGISMNVNLDTENQIIRSQKIYFNPEINDKERMRSRKTAVDTLRSVAKLMLKTRSWVHQEFSAFLSQLAGGLRDE